MKKVIAIITICLFLSQTSEAIKVGVGVWPNKKATSIIKWDTGDSILRHFKMNDNAASTVVVDATGTANGIAARNTDQFDTTGKIGGALDFNGTTDKVGCQSDFILTKAITVCAWIYPTGWGEVGKGTIAINDRFAFRIDDTNDTVGISSDITLGIANSATNSIVLNTWTFVVGTRTTDGTANLYVNGALSGNPDQNSRTPVNGTSNVFIGATSGAVRAFDGKIDDVRFYDRILSIEEIRGIYNKGVGTEKLRGEYWEL